MAESASWFHAEADPMQDVGGIVLAGSQNWGDGPFERLLRGPLLPVAHTPLVCYALDWLRVARVPTATLCAGDATRALRAFLGDGSAMGIRTEYLEDEEPRGPAGCARDAARRSPASVFVVVDGSIIPSLDLSALLRTHRASGAVATIVVDVDRRVRRGAAPTPQQPGGICVFDRRVLEGVPARGYQDIKQGLLDRLYAAGELVLSYPVKGITPRVLDCATYSSVGHWMITEEIRRPHFLSEYRRVGAGLRHPTAQVHPSARLIGPVLLGRGVVVGEDAVVIGPTSIGHGSVVGARAVVSRALVWDDCVIGEDAHVNSSLLADHAVVSAGDRLTGATCIPATTVAPRLPDHVPRSVRPVEIPPYERPAVATARAVARPTERIREIPLPGTIAPGGAAELQ